MAQRDIPGPAFYLTLLGGMDLRRPDSTSVETVLVQPKHIGLVAYLSVESATARTRRFGRRDYLVGLLWPELDQSHARAALRRVVHQVRSALGPEVLLARGDEELALDESAVRSDVAQFVAAVARSQLAHAMECYGGDLMPGFHLSGCAEFELAGR